MMGNGLSAPGHVIVLFYPLWSRLSFSGLLELEEGLEPLSLSCFDPETKKEEQGAPTLPQHPVASHFQVNFQFRYGREPLPLRPYVRISFCYLFISIIRGACVTPGLRPPGRARSL